MRKIAPLGKKSYTGKKFKSAGPNELNASDKNFIRNNINLFNIQLLAFKVGKPVAAVEKFIKKEKLVSIIENQEVKEVATTSVSVEVSPSKPDKVESPKEEKAEKSITPSVSVKVSPSKPDKVEPLKEKKAEKLVKPSVSVKVSPSKLDKVEPLKEKKAEKLVKPRVSVKVSPSKSDKVESLKEKKIEKSTKPSISVEVSPSKSDKVESPKEKKIEKLTKPSVSVKVSPSKLDKVESPKEKKVTTRKRNEKVSKKADFIRENYPKYSAVEMATMLNTSVNGVRYHLRNLNPIKTSHKVVKNPPEVILERQKFIKENHKRYTVRELSEQLNCSCDIIRINLRKLNLKALRTPQGQEISPQVINFIRVSYRTMTAREMSKALGDLSWTQIKYLCEKHGFLKTPEETDAIRHRWNRSEFTVSEEKYIIMNHGIIPLLEIAQHLGRTRSSIIQHLSRKGLKITKEQHDALNRKNFEKAREIMKAKLEAQGAEKK